MDVHRPIPLISITTFEYSIGIESELELNQYRRALLKLSIYSAAINNAPSNIHDGIFVMFILITVSEIRMLSE